MTNGQALRERLGWQLPVVLVKRDDLNGDRCPRVTDFNPGGGAV